MDDRKSEAGVCVNSTLVTVPINSKCSSLVGVINLSFPQEGILSVRDNPSFIVNCLTDDGMEMPSSPPLISKDLSTLHPRKSGTTELFLSYGPASTNESFSTMDGTRSILKQVNSLHTMPGVLIDGNMELNTLAVIHVAK